MSDIKALAVIDTNAQMILPSASDLAAIFEELADMDRIYFGRAKVASGGVGVFSILEPGAEDDDAQVAKTIDAVIISSHKVNGYWPGKYGEDKVPACSSMDGEAGTDRSTGEVIRCATCPYNQYGSGFDEKGNPGRGKACKNMRRLYLLRPGDAIPIILTLPPSSLAAFDKYRTQLTLGAKRFYTVLTRFTLTRAANEDGIAYSKVGFEAIGALPVAEAQRVKEYAEAVTKAASRASVTLDDYASSDSGEKVVDGGHTIDDAIKEKQQGIDFSKLRTDRDRETAKQAEAADAAFPITADGFVNVEADELPFTDIPTDPKPKA